MKWKQLMEFIQLLSLIHSRSVMKWSERKATEWNDKPRREWCHEINSFDFRSVKGTERTNDWMTNDRREPLSLQFTQPINSTRWIELMAVNAREGGVSGFIPFHEVHSAFINYTPWIDLAKLNGMRMNDIITVRSVKQLEDIKKVYQTPSR